MTHTQPELVTIRPQAVAPSWGWVVRRAVIGLGLMFAMTSFAAYLANASNDPDQVPSIEIGRPAAALLKK